MLGAIGGAIKADYGGAQTHGPTYWQIQHLTFVKANVTCDICFYRKLMMAKYFHREENF